MTIPKRAGRPSRKEKQQIEILSKTKTAQEIAEELGRNAESIKTFLHSNKITNEEQQIISDFRNSREYGEIREKFTSAEVEMFEDKYLSIMRQFKNDVLYTEKMQVHMLITYEILMHKNIKKMKDIDEEILKLTSDIEVLVDDARREPEREKRQEILDKVRSGNEILSNLRIGQARLDRVIQDYTDKLLKQWQLIKGTRQDRITIIENSKRTFLDMLKSFDSEKFRNEEGREMELMRMASEKEKERLSQPHRYMDDTFDLPILTSDTVELEENKKDE